MEKHSLFKAMVFLLNMRGGIGLECRATVQKAVNLIQLPFVVYAIVTLIAVYGKDVQAIQIWIFPYIEW